MFQNRFKELARTYHNFKWLMTERKNIHKSMTGSKKTFMNWKSTEVNSVMIGKCYEVGNWVNELLNTNVIKYRISYFPDKKLPDKAILYNYIVSKNEKTLTEDSFYLTSGYDNKYIWNEERKNEIEMPFKNEAWYAAKEGSGSYVFSTDLPKNGKKNVYLDYMPRRKKTDYFFMYMHLIQQSYSIMHMSTYIAEHISADGNSEVDYKKLENIDEKINRFLLKNINASVSHIGHHNDYYAYVENRLKIKEDISALKEGVEALEGILRRRGERAEKERNKGIESILGILTIMGFVSIPETMSKFLNIDMNSGSVVLGAVRWIENTFNCDLTQMSGSNTLYIITGIFIIMFLFRKKLWDIISKIKSTIYEE